MNSGKIIISGAGCAIADLIYNRVSFSGPGFLKYSSKIPGDGGLSPGKLVFTEELEKFSGKKYSEILKDIVGNRPADIMNVGGPSLVALIHVAQMLDKEYFDIKFFGITGKDENAKRIFNIADQTPLDTRNYLSISGKPTPTTDVFSDPHYDHGHGERTFVNNIGAAWDFSPDKIGDEFFDSHIQCYGGTALVPQLHDKLSCLLKRSNQSDCITVVNTVFDFRNQKNNPGKNWPLLESNTDYQYIDVLVMDCEEALRISGMDSIVAAAEFFASTAVSSFVITNGADDIYTWSGGTLFTKSGIQKFPVSRLISQELKNNPGLKGDTTGCGDNFAGGIITSLALQMKNSKKGSFSLPDAISMGVASGGFCCFYFGGTYLEKQPGEKKKKVLALKNEYFKQLNINDIIVKQ
jgi:sugar/nucleoside kinase (ribokinase family)